MKKLSILVLLLLALVIGMASCGLFAVEDVPQETSSQDTTSQEPPHVCTPSEAVIENKVDATCETEGSYDEVVYCAGCDKELSRESKSVEALGHSFTNYVFSTKSGSSFIASRSV